MENSRIVPGDSQQHLRRSNDSGQGLEDRLVEAGYHREEVLRKRVRDLLRTTLSGDDCPNSTLSCGHPYHDIEVAMRNKRNEVVHLLVNAASCTMRTGRSSAAWNFSPRCISKPLECVRN